MFKFLFFSASILLGLSSCLSTTSYVLKANNRDNTQEFDISKDTLVNVYRKNKSQKINHIAYYVKSKTVKVVYYSYLKNGEFTIEPHKSFMGKSNGNFYWYHPDSSLKMTTLFVDGKKEGTYLSYYPNKNPQCICSYMNDKRNGLQIIHWETGKVFMRAQYSEGKLINIYEYNDKEGKPRNYGTLKNGNGTFVHYNDDQSVEYVEEYQNGEMIKTSKDKTQVK